MDAYAYKDVMGQRPTEERSVVRALFEHWRHGARVSTATLADALVDSDDELDGAAVAILREAAAGTHDPAQAERRIGWLTAAYVRTAADSPERAPTLRALIDALEHAGRWTEVADLTALVAGTSMSFFADRLLALQQLSRHRAVLALLDAAPAGLPAPWLALHRARTLLLVEQFADGAKCVDAVLRARPPAPLLPAARVALTAASALAADASGLRAVVAELELDVGLDALREAAAAADLSGLERLVSGPLVASGRSAALGVVRLGYARGEWDAMLATGRDAVRTDTALSPIEANAIRSLCARVLLHRGKPSLAERLLADATIEQFGGHLVAGACAALYRALGQDDRARAVLRRAVQRAADATLRAGVGELWAELVTLTDGDPQEAMAGLRACADASGATHDRALLLRCRAATEADPELARTAAELHADRPFERAVDLLAAYRIDPADAPAGTEAYRVFAELAAAPWRRRVARLLRERGVGAPRARAATAPVARRRMRVTDLVGQGYTNQQIATTLSVSIKTVESDLTSIYAETGYRSRAALAGAGAAEPISEVTA